MVQKQKNLYLNNWFRFKQRNFFFVFNVAPIQGVHFYYAQQVSLLRLRYNLSTSVSQSYYPYFNVRMDHSFHIFNILDATFPYTFWSLCNLEQIIFRCFGFRHFDPADFSTETTGLGKVKTLLDVIQKVYFLFQIFKNKIN